MIGLHVAFLIVGAASIAFVNGADDISKGIATLVGSGVSKLIDYLPSGVQTRPAKTGSSGVFARWFV
jgi:hypothetical protein